MLTPTGFTSNHSGIQFLSIYFDPHRAGIGLRQWRVNFTNSAWITQSATDRNRSTNRHIIIRNSSRAIFDAEYTEAPASETIKPEPLYQKQFS
jgi:hypothetical protein